MKERVVLVSRANRHGHAFVHRCVGPRYSEALQNDFLAVNSRPTAEQHRARRNLAFSTPHVFQRFSIICAYRIGTPKLEPPKSFTTANVTPITRPSRFISGPPEPPEVVCAS